MIEKKRKEDTRHTKIKDTVAVRTKQFSGSCKQLQE